MVFRVAFLLPKTTTKNLIFYSDVYKKQEGKIKGHLIVLSCHADEYCLNLSLYSFACICLPKFLY